MFVALVSFLMRHMCPRGLDGAVYKDTCHIAQVASGYVRVKPTENPFVVIKPDRVFYSACWSQVKHAVKPLSSTSQRQSKKAKAG